MLGVVENAGLNGPPNPVSGKRMTIQLPGREDHRRESGCAQATYQKSLMDCSSAP